MILYNIFYFTYIDSASLRRANPRTNIVPRNLLVKNSPFDSLVFMPLLAQEQLPSNRGFRTSAFKDETGWCMNLSS